jgi:hypothetical protein
MINFREIVRKVARRDDGAALAMVVGIGAVMLLLVTTATTMSVSGVMTAKHDQDWNAAMSAAYAGVGDYQSRLANDYAYVQYGDPNALFAKANPDNVVALPPVGQENPAFGIGASGFWATVAGSGGNASYRYEVDNSNYSKTGVLRIRSTGRVGSETRSIVADLKQQGFIDFLYFTDYEIKDPELNSGSCTVEHAWALSSRPSNCLIQFASGDVIDGPLHSNDTMVMCGGSTFKGLVTTSNPKLSSGKRYINSGCASTSSPNFLVATSPAYAKTIGMPPTNAKMIQETRNDLPKTVQRPGCLFTGPTVITFLSNGKMKVRSPWTRETQIAGDPATSGTHPAMCGTPGNPLKTESQNAGTLSGVDGQTIDVLDHNLVYVQGVPRTNATDPNYWASSKSPNNSTFKCVGAARSSGQGNGLGFPMADETAPAVTASGASYGCDVGDVFVSGAVNASMTVAASHFVYITGNITRQDPQNDVLGLVGTGAVWVWNPYGCIAYNRAGNCTNNGTLLTDTDRTIEAAVLSVAHSFQVQNFDTGDNRGRLNVTGAIAQKFRGTVGTSGGSTGYLKTYVYDSRLRNIAPPKFLSPVSTTYGVNVLVEVKTAFNPDGTPIP